MISNDNNMKSFVKMVLAVMTGIFLMGILGFFLFIGFIGSMAVAGSAKPLIPREGALVIDMSTVSVSDQGQPGDPMSVIRSGSLDETITLRSAVQAINIAAGFGCHPDYRAYQGCHLPQARRRLCQYRPASGTEERPGEFPLQRKAGDFICRESLHR